MSDSIQDALNEARKLEAEETAQTDSPVSDWVAVRESAARVVEVIQRAHLLRDNTDWEIMFPENGEEVPL